MQYNTIILTYINNTVVIILGMLVTMLQTIVKVPVFLSSLVDPLFPVNDIIDVVLLYLPVL